MSRQRHFAGDGARTRHGQAGSRGKARQHGCPANSRPKGIKACLKNRPIVLDTSICIDYMINKMADNALGNKQIKKFVHWQMKSNIDTRIPNCIDAALVDGRVFLPEKALSEFQGYVNNLTDSMEIDADDVHRLRMTRLCGILYDYIDLEDADCRHRDILATYDDGDLKAVKDMFDGFGNDPRLAAKVQKIRNMGKPYPPDGGDMEILATALTLSKKHSRQFCLLAADSHFTVLAQDIHNKLYVRIVSGFSHKPAGSP